MAATPQLVQAYIAVGSNIDPEANIPRALDLLRAQVRVTGISTAYRVPAFDRTDQADFVNAVAAVETTLGSRQLKFEVLRPIESQLGRVRTADRFADRTIDLDLILYGDSVIDEADLRVPDADIARPFVAGPLLELAGEVVLPGGGGRVCCSARDMHRAGMTPLAELTRQLKERLRE